MIERCINEYSAEKGTMPTVREIEQFTNIPWSTVARYLSYMNEKGTISYSGRARWSMSE